MNVLIAIDDSAVTAYLIRPDGIADPRSIARVPLFAAALRGPDPEQWMHDGESWVVGDDAIELERHHGALGLDFEFLGIRPQIGDTRTADQLKQLIGGIAAVRDKLQAIPANTVFAIALNGERSLVPFWLVYALRRFKWTGAVSCLDPSHSAEACSALSEGKAFARSRQDAVEVPLRSLLGDKKIAVESPRGTKPFVAISANTALPRFHNEDFTTRRSHGGVDEGTLSIWYSVESGTRHEPRTHTLRFGTRPQPGIRLADVLREDALQNSLRAKTRVDEWGRLTVSLVDLEEDQPCVLRAVNKTQHRLLRGSPGLFVQHLIFESPDEIVDDPDLPEKLDAVAFAGKPLRLASVPDIASSSREIVEVLRLGVQRFVSAGGQPARMEGADLLKLAAAVFVDRKDVADPEADEWVIGRRVATPDGPFLLKERGSPASIEDEPESVLACLLPITPDELGLLKQDLRLAAESAKVKAAKGK